MSDRLMLVIAIVPVTIGFVSLLYGWRFRRDDVGCIGTGMVLLGLAVFTIWWFFVYGYSFTR